MKNTFRKMAGFRRRVSLLVPVVCAVNFSDGFEKSKTYHEALCLSHTFKILFVKPAQFESILVRIIHTQMTTNRNRYYNTGESCYNKRSGVNTIVPKKH